MSEREQQIRNALATVAGLARELMEDEFEPCGFCATEAHVYLCCGAGCFEALKAKSLKAQKLAGAIVAAEALLEKP